MPGMVNSEMSKANPEVIVGEDSLKQFCTRVLILTGVPPEHADAIAASLIEADLQAVTSHGVVRLPIYVRRLRAGVINPHPNVQVAHETATTAVIDGDNGMGQWVAMRGMQMAIYKAQRGNCAFVSVRNSNHFGAASYYARMALPHDMIGISLTIGGINHMTPWGGAQAILGNNPFAIALPAGQERPVVLDMACSTAARGKIIVAAKDGTPIPDNWATGPNGEATTDPVQALKGFMLPIGGPKGYSLTLVIGLLSTMLSGAAFGSEVTHMYEDFERPQNIGHLFGVLPIASFEPIEIYKRRMDKAIREIRATPRAQGVERIYLPGEREELLAEEYRRTGIPVQKSVWTELQEVGNELGVALPA
jgi:LDH2 family malate/lactate/ureidoglycolate dehydrogenase